ncbi:MAG: M15 family metallopeptidase [Bacteroidetes bacterium]|nr:M15 family metallopeptidase [Bacteroidota bacterium]
MKKVIFILLPFIAIVCTFEACDYFAQSTQEMAHERIADSLSLAPKIRLDSVANSIYIPVPLVVCEMEKSMMGAGLVDVRTMDTSIVVDLKYSTCNNFLGLDMYGDFNKCYLQPDVAAKLSCAQEILKSKFPFYNLIVYDAVRARSVQRKMWDTISVPYSERSKYVSNPNNGSLHNFGAAVDISIIDEHGIELDMGTPYDYFGELAYPREEERMLDEGKLTHIQLLNRSLLREVMESAGFMGITTEWWHFNSCYRTEAYEKYTIIE